jgi:signal peptidase II
MYIAAVISMVMLIGIDQFTKFLTVKYLMPVHSVTIINNFFELTYVENRGAAFGFLQGAKWLFVIIAIVILIVGAVYYSRLVKENGSKFIRYALILIGAGAIGNVIDRLFRSFVVDMLNFNILGYDFPVFNFADICVCVGAAVFAIAVLFFKEEK